MAGRGISDLQATRNFRQTQAGEIWNHATHDIDLAVAHDLCIASLMNVESIKFRKHDCFKNDWAGFDSFKPVNVIIGRNNTGKSRLLDLVEALCENKARARKWDLKIFGKITQRDMTEASNRNGSNYWEVHAKHFVDLGVAAEFDRDDQHSDLQVHHNDGLFVGAPSHQQTLDAKTTRLSLLQDVAKRAALPLAEKTFRRLLAERNISPEKSGTGLALGSDGHGATNIIRRYLRTTHKSLPPGIIQTDLLDALNEIFRPDGRFTEIDARHHDEPERPDQSVDHWEIYLAEEKKGLVALSRSGSGLKTVLLVLLNLLVVPAFQAPLKKKSHYVFAFEELENNLHPALLRRLLTYIQRYAVENKSMIFLTTHSSVALDVFGQSPNAQIIHVRHDGESATAHTVPAHFDRQGIVAELGAKPSDLLQANGIVWVEGPSDRLYLSRWIELCSKGELKEGRDYACVWYAGALLARAQFRSPDEATE
ncbi:MAG: AAA family ATPase, partial [Opitutaceae bacterium]